MVPRKTFATSLVVAAFSCAVLATQARAQEQPEREALILSPPAGAVVKSPVTVTYGFQSNGGANDNGGMQHRTPHAFLVIDTPTPPAGTLVQAGAQFIPFPSGQMQLTVTLPPGQHRLQIVIVNREDHVSKHVFAANPVSITVQP